MSVDRLYLDLPGEVVKNLFIGNHLHASLENWDIVISLGCLEFPKEQYANSLVTGRFHFHMIDDVDEDISQYLPSIVNRIHQALVQRKRVYVHCKAGISRSAAIVLAYLMRYKDLSYENAFILLKKARHQVCPNEGYIKQLKVWEKECKRQRLE